MNKVILMGRLTRDPDVRYSQNDGSMAIARFTIAVDRRFKRDGSDQSADFISCVAFGKTAQFFENYVHQGTKLCVEGRIQTGSYVNRDGAKVYTTDVVVENAEFAESKAVAGQGTPNQGQNQQAPAQNYQQQAPAQSYQQQAPAPAQNYQQQAPAQNYQRQTPPATEASNEGFMSLPDGLDDEGLPFN